MLRKKNIYLQKTFIYFQALASALEKYDYINFAFETNANNS